MTSNVAICLLSGGPDSVVAALLMREQGFALKGLYVDYGQRTRLAEAERARATADWLGVLEFRTCSVPFLGEVGGSAITDVSTRVSTADPTSEYVPFRNTVFLSAAVAWAEASGAAGVVAGSIGGPWITPDNSPEYYERLNALIHAGTRAEVTAYAPLNRMSKAEVIREGAQRGVPFELTWSCQNDTDVPCGRCNNCVDREKAFAANGLADPLRAGRGR